MKRYVVVLMHVTYWLMHLSMTASTLVGAGTHFTGSVVTITTLDALKAIIIFYTFYLVLVPRYLARRQVKKFIRLGILTSFVTSVLVFAVGITINRVLQLDAKIPPHQSEPFEFILVILNWLVVMIFYTLVGVMNGLLASFMKGFQLWYDEIHVKELLKKQNLETELSLIKARIDPHFLFNTLNNIDTLIKNDAVLASLYLQKLCSIMRFTLYENNAPAISLEKEMDIMQEYIALERIRATTDFISVNVAGNMQRCMVAPMTLLPFVENAIKHSDGRRTLNAISIHLNVTADNVINFRCRNVIGSHKKSSEGGIGMDLVKNRLNLLYPRRHNLVITEKDGYFEVELVITPE